MEFLYQIQRKEKEHGIEIFRYYSNEKFDTEVKVDLIPYRILLRKEDFDKIKIKNEKIKTSDNNYKNYQGEDIIELLVEDKELTQYIISKARELEFRTYEADLLDENRFLIDNHIKIAKQDFKTLKYVSLDIETVGEVNNQEIVLVSLYSPFSELKQVYFNKKNANKDQLSKIKSHNFEDFELIVCEDEKELLIKFTEKIIDFGTQMLIGWNVIDFDFKVIKEKMDLYGLAFKLSKFEGETKLRVVNDFMKSSTMSAPGVVVFDVINLLKMNFIDFEDYKLNTVAREVLGDNKIELLNDENADNSIEDKINTINNMFENDLITLIEYNLKDSILTSQILEKLDLMNLMCKRSILTDTPLEKVKSPIATLDLMYLRELHKRGFIASSNFNFQDTTPIEGAFVLDPIRGFYENVLVYDFKSLYPSIIMTFNIDPFTYQPENGPITAPNNAKFSKDKGILPEIIKNLMKERDIAKKEKDKIKSFALKITMNSFYGAIASPKSRFYNKEIGEAITAFGRQLIQKTKKQIEDTTPHKVIYSDTDSCFVKFEGLEKDIDIEGKGLEDALNEYFEQEIKREYGQESYLTLELEKVFSKFFIASKKRYVGYDEITKKTIYVGLEAIRGDWTDIAKNFQRQLIDIIFAGKKDKEIEEFILKYITDLKEHKFDPDLFVYTKKITKPLNMYTKTTPPHVRAARELKNFDGRIVKYIMTKDGPKHVSLIDESTQLDYDHYIDKQLKGVSDDILEVLNIDFDSVIYSKKQKSLDRFF